MLPSLISSNQTAYVNGRLISEGGRLLLLSFLLKKTFKIYQIHLAVLIHTVFADDTIFFLSREKYIPEVIQTFEHFSFSRLKSNKSKCKIAVTRVLKMVQRVFCGMQFVKSKTDTIKILEIHFSYNEILVNDKNYRARIIKVEKFLKLWRMRQLIIEGINLI